MTRVRTLSTVAAALALAVAYLLSSAPGATTSASGPAGEGITVHGHWDIDVHEPDGTYVRGTEFENALTSVGGVVLADVLGRQATVGSWQVRIHGPTQPCDNGSGIAVVCSATETTPAGPNEFQTLSLDLSTPGELVLSGQVTVQNDTDISQVSTGVWTCSPTVAPGDQAQGCRGSGPKQFTLKSAGVSTFDAIPVEVGQVVTINVTLSFS